MPATAPRRRAAAARRRGAGHRASPARKPASNASPAPVVSAAGIGVVATSKRRGLPSARMWIEAPLRPRLTTAIGASSSSAAPRTLARGAPSPRHGSRTGGPARPPRSAPSPRRRPSASSGAVEARSTVTSAPASRPRRIASIPARPSGSSSSEYAGRWTASAPANQAGLRSSGRSRSAAPRSWTKRALAVGLDEHADPPGPRARDADRPHRDAVAVAAGPAPAPAASRPTAHTSVERAPSRPSQRAAVAADPPGRGEHPPADVACRARCRAPARGPRRPRCRRRRPRAAGPSARRAR